MGGDREYVEYLLSCITFILEKMGRKQKGMGKVLRFYRKRLEEWLKVESGTGVGSGPGVGTFTEPLVADYILRAMVMLRVDK